MIVTEEYPGPKYERITRPNPRLFEEARKVQSEYVSDFAHDFALGALKDCHGFLFPPLSLHTNLMMIGNGCTDGSDEEFHKFLHLEKDNATKSVYFL